MTTVEQEIELARIFSGVDYKAMCNGGIIVYERDEGVCDNISNVAVNEE
jgi:hypothetical protein